MKRYTIREAKRRLKRARLAALRARIPVIEAQIELAEAELRALDPVGPLFHREEEAEPKAA